MSLKVVVLSVMAAATLAHPSDLRVHRSPDISSTISPAPAYQAHARPTPSYHAPPAQYHAPARYAEGPVRYDTQYAVRDDYSGNDFGHQESRDGYNTQGSYYVVLPDTRRQTVNYYVNGDSGYVADVTYEGEAQYPDSYGHGPSYGRTPSYGHA